MPDDLRARAIAWLNEHVPQFRSCDYPTCDACEDMVSSLAAALADVRAGGETRPEGTWPEHCEQRAFVAGAKWWQFHANGATAFGAERRAMEAEAVKRYGEPRAGGEAKVCALCGKPQPCSQHGRTPVTDADFAELSQDLAEMARPSEVERLREALRKVRAHTSYAYPDPELLKGLLQSVERIVDAALTPPPEEK